MIIIVCVCVLFTCSLLPSAVVCDSIWWWGACEVQQLFGGDHCSSAVPHPDFHPGRVQVCHLDTLLMQPPQPVKFTHQSASRAVLPDTERWWERKLVVGKESKNNTHVFTSHLPLGFCYTLIIILSQCQFNILTSTVANGCEVILFIHIHTDIFFTHIIFCDNDINPDIIAPLKWRCPSLHSVSPSLSHCLFTALMNPENKYAQQLGGG